MHTVKAEHMPHIVISGGADGIGRALALRYAHAGYAVTILDRDRDRAAAVCQEISARGGDVAFIYVDLASEHDIAAALHELASRPPADVVVHSAGISAVGPFASGDLARQLRVLDINLRAPLLLSAAMLRANQIAPGGALVFIASLSVFTGYPGAAVYAASKDGITAYARSLRVALRRRGINVLTVFPGPTRTAHARRYSPDNRHEQRRMAPESLAEAIYQAVRRRRSTLIPGLANRLAAVLGSFLPALSEFIMRKTIFEKIK